MARVFAITTTATSLRLDGQGQAEAPFTVSNASGRALRGRADVRATNAAQQGWLSISGEAERNFPANGTHQIVVRVAAPPGTAAGKGSFRLDMVSAQNPDDDFAEGPTVTFEIPPPVVKPSFPWWIVIVAATVVLIVGGLAAYLMMRKPAPQTTTTSTAPATTTPPATAAPPGPTTLACSQEQSLRSPQTGTPASSIEFVNSRTAAVKIYWLNGGGQRTLYRTLTPGQSYTQGTFVSHPWVITDPVDNCLTIYRPAQSSDRVVIR
jgi:hypothetical protein